MKKVLVLLLMVVVLVGCGQEDSKNKLYLFNWSDYIPDEVITDFENETGIEVITDYYSSNEEMYAKIKAGGDGYDIAVPSSDYAEIMLKQGMLEKIDHSKTPNCEWFTEDDIIKIKAIRDIMAGEELTLKYKWYNVSSSSISAS